MRTAMQNTRHVDHIRFNLTLIRHAETHANAEGIIQGLTDTELSNIGYLQSQALGRHLQDHRFSHIYSSDLKRAAETARQIRSLNRVSPCEIQFDSLLRERMYGVAEGRTRQWLRELAKESGVPYSNFTPSGAETIVQVRERVILFFQTLCQDLLRKFGTNSTLPSSVKPDKSTLLPKQDHIPPISHSVSSDDLSFPQQTITNVIRKRSLSAENIPTKLRTNVRITTSCQSSIDSALDLSSVTSDQRSRSSSISTISRNSSFEKHRNLLKGSLPSPYENHFSDLEILIVSHGAVIRELIKYFACDLQTDIGQHFDTIQDIAPNTSVTRFEVTYSTTDDRNPTITLELVDYHNKTHLITSNNEEVNLDVINKCNL